MPTFVNVKTKEIRDSVPESELGDNPDWANVGTRDNLPQSPKYGWRFEQDDAGDWTVRGATEEEEAQDQAELLTIAIASKTAEVEDRFSVLFDELYPPRRQRTLTWMLVAARQKGLDNRLDYIMGIDDFLMTGLQLLEICVNDLSVKETVGAVVNIDTSWLEVWIEMDPKVSIFEAARIAN
jgi:hypothetical protein